LTAPSSEGNEPLRFRSRIRPRPSSPAAAPPASSRPSSTARPGTREEDSNGTSCDEGPQAPAAGCSPPRQARRSPAAERCRADPLLLPDSAAGEVGVRLPRARLCRRLRLLRRRLGEQLEPRRPLQQPVQGRLERAVDLELV